MSKPLHLPALCIVLTGLAAPAFAACDKPGKEPFMPQGATASEEEMTAGRTAIQAHVQKLEAYQACLESQIKAASADTSAETKAQWQAEADTAVDRAQMLAEIYSAQLRAFKSRSN